MRPFGLGWPSQAAPRALGGAAGDGAARARRLPRGDLRSRRSTGGSSPRPRAARSITCDLDNGTVGRARSWRSFTTRGPGGRAANRVPDSASSSSAPLRAPTGLRADRARGPTRATPRALGPLRRSASAGGRQPARSTRRAQSPTPSSARRSVRSSTAGTRRILSLKRRSIRRWAAARSWSRPAGIWPPRTSGRSSARRRGRRRHLRRPTRSDCAALVAERCLFGVDRIRWRCSSRGCRCGWRRWPPTAADVSRSSPGAGNSLIGASPWTTAPPPAGPAAGRCRSTLFERSDALCRYRAARWLSDGPDDTVADVRAKEASLAAASPTTRTGALEGRLRSLVRGLVPGALDRELYTRCSTRPRASNDHHTLLNAARERPPRPRRTGSSTGRSSFRRSFSTPTDATPGRRVRRGGRQPAVGDAAWRRRALPAAAATRGRWCGSLGTPVSPLHQARGHVNQFQLFVERALHLARPGGRLGLIVPARLHSDVGSERLRRALARAQSSRCVDVVPQSPRNPPDSPERAICDVHRDAAAAETSGDPLPLRRQRSRGR